MTRARTYRMTVSSAWYDKTERGAKEYELHLRVSRKGKIRTVRRTLARRGINYFQGYFYRRLKKWIRKRKIKVRFQREEPAPSVERQIAVEGRSILFRGKRFRAIPLPTRPLSYSKKRRRRRRVR